MWLLWLSIVIAVAAWYFNKSRQASAPRLGQAEPATFDAQTTAQREPHGTPTDLNDDRDAWEGAFYDVASQRTAKKTVRLRYIDGNGQQSERVVDIRAYEPSGIAGLLIGRCHLRNATRTFRFDRISEVIDMETGEVIPDLRERLNAEWEASPARSLDELCNEHLPALKLLLYMAKADGSVRVAELDVIAKHFQIVTGDSRIDSTHVKTLLQNVDVISVTSFTRTYNALRRERPDEATRVADACRAIVATQNTVHPNEQSALDILDKPPPKSKKPSATQ